MELIRRADGFAPQECVVTIGSFDGLHLGHRALIDRLLSQARARRLSAMMLSFEPLPREVLRPLDPPARLTNFRERWRLLEDSGIERLCLLPFGRTLRALTAPQFMQLLRAAGARCVVVGHDFRFGHGGQADAQWGAQHAAEYGLEFDVLEAVRVQGERVSSGLVREALLTGDFARARTLLGRAYSMRGRVRQGNRLGRELGFPTANVPVLRRRVPLQGIFAVRVHGAGLVGWPGVASLGTRPMAGGGVPLLEAHLFDFARDLYGCELEVEFVAKLREEQRFASLEVMRLQMERDAAEARQILQA